MTIKYRNKTYSSEDIPLFIYFKENDNQKEFLNILRTYNTGEFCKLKCVFSILAGNTVIKDKRAPIYFCIEDDDEKRILQKSLFDNVDDNNAMICSPPDINERVIGEWVDKNINKII